MTPAFAAPDLTRSLRRCGAVAILARCGAVFLFALPLRSALRGQSLGPAPVAVDSAVASRLAVHWRELTKPTSVMVCLYGHVAEDSILVFDSEVLLQGDPATACPDRHHTLMGAVGFIDGSRASYSEHDVMDAMCGLLKTQPRWLFAGEVHGVAPTLFPDGRSQEGPLVWGCAREPGAGPRT